MRRVRQVAAAGHVPRHRAVLFVAICAGSLIPWTIGLAVTLPRQYVVSTWTLTWTGFDVVLIGCFSVTAWALWKQRQIAIPAAMITSVLLLSDAWFDLLTAHRGTDLLVSTVTALFVEIPIAIVLAAISTTLFRASAGISRDPEIKASARSLWRTPTNSQASWLLTAPRPLSQDPRLRRPLSVRTSRGQS
jgi:hypothetical protein